MKNLIIRTLTGIIFLAVMIGGILYSPITFSLLFTVITALSVWEFTGIVNQRADVSVNRFITTVAGGCLFVGFFGYAAGLPGGGVLFVPWLLSMIYLLVAELYLQRESPLNNWAYSMLSQVYVALPFSLLCLLEFSALGRDAALAVSSHTGSWLVLAVYVLPSYVTSSLLFTK